MALNIIKLAVGIEDIDQLAPRQARLKNTKGNFTHRTRMMPSRIGDIIPGGSLYWVIKGAIQVRQPIIAFHKKTDSNGKGYCLIELEMNHILVEPTAKRPFQGWRYLRAEDAPPDISKRSVVYVDPGMPKDMRLELKRLGLI